jgi:signal transduction histidine kinase
MPIAQLETSHAPSSRSSETELNRQRALFEKQAGMAQILDAMPNMVAILNQDRQIVLANTALIDGLGGKDATRVIGCRPGEILGCPHAMENGLGCGTTRSCRTCGATNAILAAQMGQVATRECSILPLHKLDALDLRITATPLDMGDERFVIFAIQDIAHEKRVELLHRTFFHDILNSAGGVQGLSYLVDDAEDMGEVHEYAPLLVNQAEQMVTAIEAQRDMLAAERGDLVVSDQPVGSLTMIQAAMDLYGSHEVAEGKTIARDPGSARLILATSKSLLQRTLGNMLKNALEASAVGDTVTIGCEDGSGTARFWVQNPTVMPESVRLQVFNRSFSTKGTGRGIGTYSMKLLGEKYLGGKVGFSSAEGQGTRFWIELPCRDDGAGA